VNHKELQWGWQPVTGKVRQFELDLFSVKRDAYLAAARVSLDDLARWRANGWISFDATDLDELSEPLCNELVFIRNLARSGLSDHQIGALLAKLEAPYQYDPGRTAYSFAYGWVQPPPVLDKEEANDFVRFHLQTWIDQKVRSRDVEILRELSSLLFNAVLKADTKRGEESDNE
jgi:hypothetical protein